MLPGGASSSSSSAEGKGMGNSGSKKRKKMMMGTKHRDDLLDDCIDLTTEAGVDDDGEHELLPDIEHILTQHVDLEDDEDPSSAREVTMIMRVCTMHSLKPDEYRSCPIALEDFDKVQVDYMTGSEEEAAATSIPNSNDNCFVEDVPEYCVGRLPCGHHFHPVAVLCHMVVNGMNCPVCRSGTKKLVGKDSIPPHLRVNILRNVRKRYMVEMEQLMRNDSYVARQMSQGEVAASRRMQQEILVSRGPGLPEARVFASFIGPMHPPQNLQSPTSTSVPQWHHHMHHHSLASPPTSRRTVFSSRDVVHSDLQVPVGSGGEEDMGPASSLIVALERDLLRNRSRPGVLSHNLSTQAIGEIVDEEITQSIMAAWRSLMTVQVSSAAAAGSVPEPAFSLHEEEEEHPRPAAMTPSPMPRPATPPPPPSSRRDVVSSMRSVMLIVYVYSREDDHEGPSVLSRQQMSRRRSSAWHIKGFEYEMSRASVSSSQEDPVFEMDEVQLAHLARSMRGVDAVNLRFTVYTRVQPLGGSSGSTGEGGGSILELLNTGMIAMSMLELEGGADDLVLDFEDDGKLVLSFRPQPAVASHATAANSVFTRLRSLRLVASSAGADQEGDSEILSV